MSFFERVVKLGKFGLVAAMIAMVGTMLAAPASAAPAAEAASVVQSEKGDVGINVPAYNCTYTYDVDDFRWDCNTGAGPGYLRAYVSCASGTTYYSAWWPANSYFWLQVHCAGYWTTAGLQGLG